MSKLVEEWRPIEGFEGLYEVSDWGRVRRFPRKFRNVNRFTKGGFCKFIISEDGYFRVHLNDGIKRTLISVHRLVAFAFIDIPSELKPYIGTQQLQINHKDENKQNNCVWNLEWCDSRYNNTYNERHLKCAKKIKEANTLKSGKKVLQFTLDGELIATYPSTWEASRQTGFTKQGIMIACHKGQWRNGKWVNTNTYKGFVWKYATD